MHFMALPNQAYIITAINTVRGDAYHQTQQKQKLKLIKKKKKSPIFFDLLIGSRKKSQLCFIIMTEST